MLRSRELIPNIPARRRLCSASLTTNDTLLRLSFPKTETEHLGSGGLRGVHNTSASKNFRISLTQRLITSCSRWAKVDGLPANLNRNSLAPDKFQIGNVEASTWEQAEVFSGQSYSRGVPSMISRTISRAKDSSSGCTKIFLAPGLSESQRQ